MPEPPVPKRKLLRWKGFDYSTATGYFITLCTHKRECLLGAVQAGEIELSESGRIAWECWEDLPQHYPILVLDEFVVMPNHLHAVLFFLTVEELLVLPGGACAGTACVRPQPVSLSEVIRFFKTTSAKRINRLQDARGATVWQRSFHDHVIRRDQRIDAFRRYILRNPQEWEQDPDAISGRVAKT